MVTTDLLNTVFSVWRMAQIITDLIYRDTLEMLV